jgi:aromatic ring-opening dioxygenase LigB subunit
MPLVYACIAPHGEEIVPRLAGKDMELFSPTRNGMRRLAAQMKGSKPETIIVASPHNLRLAKHIGVVTSENSRGEISRGKKSLRVNAKCDVELANLIVAKAEKKGIPVVGANYGALSGTLSNLPMDWGTLIPLWFFMKPSPTGKRIVIVTPSRGIHLTQNFEFGRLVADVSEERETRIAFVASADQAHSHKKKGPYGFSSKASEYDRLVVEAIRANDLRSTMAFEPGFVDAAKPDSLWQMTMLAGVLDRVPMESQLLSYQVPTYYGMLCAGFKRKS